ncbi:MAG: DUF1080 domain-containing protein [Thermoguttaceae bacterium]|nr:DUF1080 domain-containing protein [Thermoguttaceae bacterium]MDO4425001.1 DUF1080 domain-containing protein [Planctomycetia bacterium]
MKKILFSMFSCLLLSASCCLAADCCQPLFGDKLEKADFNADIWSINENGELCASRDAAIWTKEKIGDCTVSFEYKLSERANAGFLIKCSDKGNWIPNTIEIQLLDDAGSQPNYHGNAAFYGYQAPTKVATKPAGEWNKMVVECKGSIIKIWLNGEKVNEMDMSQWKDNKISPNGTEIEKKFQGKALADADTVGFIGFQGLHGKSTIYYRNIRICK